MPRRPPFHRFERKSEAQIHKIGVLTGDSPESLIADLSLTGASLPSPPSVPAGLPSDLLRRRPDIRAAERNLAAATADIGAATADLYPRFSLSAAPALVSTALASLLEWGSRNFSGGAAIDWPIFNGGRTRATIDVRTAQQEQALIAYRKTILTALQDVEDALAKIENDRGEIGELRLSITVRWPRRGDCAYPLHRRARPLIRTFCKRRPNASHWRIGWSRRGAPRRATRWRSTRRSAAAGLKWPKRERSHEAPSPTSHHHFHSRSCGGRLGAVRPQSQDALSLGLHRRRQSRSRGARFGDARSPSPWSMGSVSRLARRPSGSTRDARCARRAGEREHPRQPNSNLDR